MMHELDGCWHMGGMWLFSLAAIAAACAFIWWLTRITLFRNSGNKTPQEILKKRYASGDIDKKEFEEKMKGLK